MAVVGLPVLFLFVPSMNFGYQTEELFKINRDTEKVNVSFGAFHSPKKRSEVIRKDCTLVIFKIHTSISGQRYAIVLTYRELKLHLHLYILVALP